MAHHSSILDKEHDELLEQLEDASRENNGLSKLFKEMHTKFLVHLDKENDTILPLLSYVKEVADGRVIGENQLYRTAGQKFIGDYDKMISEHRIMQDLIGKVTEQLKVHPNVQMSNLARALLEHIEIEEEFLYPAAKMAAKNIKLEQEASRIAVR